MKNLYISFVTYIGIVLFISYILLTADILRILGVSFYFGGYYRAVFEDGLVSLFIIIEIIMMGVVYNFKLKKHRVNLISGIIGLLFLLFIGLFYIEFDFYGYFAS